MWPGVWDKSVGGEGDCATAGDAGSFVLTGMFENGTFSLNRLVEWEVVTRLSLLPCDAVLLCGKAVGWLLSESKKTFPVSVRLGCLS